MGKLTKGGRRPIPSRLTTREREERKPCAEAGMISVKETAEGGRGGREGPATPRKKSRKEDGKKSSLEVSVKKDQNGL